MKLTSPIDRSNLNAKTDKKYQLLKQLINALEEKNLTEEFIRESNKDIDALNQIDSASRELGKSIGKTQSTLVSRAQKQLKLVPKNYYKTLWLAVGMSAFGIPLGLAFSTALDNYAFIGIGLPIGLSIGIALGTSLDQKAQKEGKQLNVELNK